MPKKELLFVSTLPLSPIDFGESCMFQFILASSLISTVFLTITSNYYRKTGKYLSAHARSRSHFISHSNHSHFVLMNSFRFTSFELQLCMAVKSNYVDFHKTESMFGNSFEYFSGVYSKFVVVAVVVVAIVIEYGADVAFFLDFQFLSENPLNVTLLFVFCYFNVPKHYTLY